MHGCNWRFLKKKTLQKKLASKKERCKKKNAQMQLTLLEMPAQQ
jgi:hypothetical protein